MFGGAHLLLLALIAGITLGFLLWFRRSPHQVPMMRIMAGTMLLLELAKDLTLAAIGAFSRGYLPLHLCSIAMFVCLCYSLRPGSRRCGQILYSVCFPGALCALLFPDWTCFPLFHFQSIHSFLYHTMLIQFALIPVVTGRIRPGLDAVPISFGFLLLTALPVGQINRLLGTNFMFLNHASPGSPLEFLSVLPGRAGYLAGYGLLALAVLILVNLLPDILSRLRRLRPTSA